ncbi:hypothetical protein E3E22_07515 [Thermococcus sp. MV5]|uniref:alkaline phosphatase family protein n=1 Tax=Thermococcus sp. MV5 TaxID=1638272 RepID=UPI00143942E5|nr:alkaline phosphatase family protein [Thermococcus sp. MV5]NJE26463.1 hypothetical protein [Thermococcus sp. MV5]
MHKFLIIGLDGATWDVLMPLIKGEKLSTLEKLVKNGSYGVLELIVPPVTGDAWLIITN